jgi:hypothetical protein
MNTITIPKTEYQKIIRRQSQIEKELLILRKIVWAEVSEERIRPVVLKRWECISQGLDQGKGRSFASLKEMKVWLRKL